MCLITLLKAVIANAYCVRVNTYLVGKQRLVEKYVCGLKYNVNSFKQ